MATLNERFLKTWAETRQRGLKYYMLVEGSIFGVLVFIITGLLSLWDVSFKEAFDHRCILHDASLCIGRNSHLLTSNVVV